MKNNKTLKTAAVVFETSFIVSFAHTPTNYSCMWSSQVSDFVGHMYNFNQLFAIVYDATPHRISSSTFFPFAKTDRGSVGIHIRTHTESSGGGQSAETRRISMKMHIHVAFGSNDGSCPTTTTTNPTWSNMRFASNYTMNWSARASLCVHICVRRCCCRNMSDIHIPACNVPLGEICKIS